MKKKRITVITLVGIIIIIIGSILLITAEPKLDTSWYKLVDNLKVDVYSQKKVSDFISSIEGKVITNKKINTEKLGKQ